jgi:hypothetical protein
MQQNNTMKRSSSIAALSDHPEVPDRMNNNNNNEWNYQDELLATNMMLVSIDEETNNNHSFMQRNTQSGSMGSMASSRCSSRGSMTSSCSGWGSTTSRKSYKVDLCALGATAVDLDGSSSQQQQVVGGETFTKPSSKSSQQAVTISSAHSATPADSGDSWGFFVDSAF